MIRAARNFQNLDLDRFPQMNLLLCGALAALGKTSAGQICAVRAGCVVGPVCEYQDQPLCLCQDSGPKILPAEDEESSWRKPLFDAASDHDDLHGKSDASKVKMKMSKMVGEH